MDILNNTPPKIYFLGGWGAHTATRVQHIGNQSTLTKKYKERVTNKNIKTNKNNRSERSGSLLIKTYSKTISSSKFNNLPYSATSNKQRKQVRYTFKT